MTSSIILMFLDIVTYPFTSGENIENTGIYIRDIAESKMILQEIMYSTFNINNQILSQSILPAGEQPSPRPNS